MKICNARVYRGGVFSPGEIEMDGGRFAPSSDGVIFDAGGLLAIPGLVDIHFHGCAGYDLCDGTEEAIQAIADYQERAGVLAICPATMTVPEERLTEIARTAARHQNGKGADLVGLHMEGPFINPGKAGAQNTSDICLPDAGMFLRLQEAAGGLFKICSLAPEMPGAMEFIAVIKKDIPVISLAHTEADYDTAARAFLAGASHLTHCCNAMQGIHHRRPGPILAAADAGADAELICDCVHVHPAAARAVFRLFGDDHIILISDSMMACGLPDGRYSLGGQAVTVRGRTAVLTGREEVIAGSAANLMDCLRCAVLEMGIPLTCAVKAASHNPARSIGVDRDYGDIAPGLYANVLLLDDSLSLIHVFHKGEKIF